jgi:hypothetical protein
MINGIETPVMRIVGNDLRWDLMTFPFQNRTDGQQGRAAQYYEGEAIRGANGPRNKWETGIPAERRLVQEASRV